MTAAQQDITIEQGATFLQKYTWLIDDVAQDLTGLVIRMQVRETKASTIKTIDISTIEGSITITDATGGKFEVEIGSDVTAAITIDKGFYDIEVVDTAPTPDFVTRLIEGKVTVSKEVTR